MENLDSVLRMVEGELGAFSKNGKFRSREEIDSVYKLIDIAKDIYCIWQYEDDEEYSENYRMNSYSRGRRNAKRDNMGRYSRTGYSYEYVDHLREMMEDAPDEQTRQNLQRMISQMENH